jgi:transketolase
MTTTTEGTVELSINTIRTLSMDAVEKAKSGHPGAPMALAPLAFTLYTRVMRHSPDNPDWFNRDRFILSAGHASMLLYSTLYLAGYGISLDDLKNFRQLGSPTAGHPEYRDAPGIEATTGPLGQGISMSVGIALAERMLAARFNSGDHDLIDHHTYVIASDGDMQEGVASEASSLAGHLGLGWSSSMTTTTSSSRARRRWPSARTSASASRPTAGTCRTWARTSRWRRSSAPPRRPRPWRIGPRS